MKRIISAAIVSLIFIVSFVGLAQAALSDYFVDTEWLAVNRSDVVVLDVRKAPLYYLGHIDGALHVDRSEFLSTRNGVKSLVPTTVEFSALMSRLGVTPETTVVVYAKDSDPYAARLVWTLQYHGHLKSFVLDGGYDKWSLEGRTVSVLPSSAPAPTDYRLAVAEPGPDLRAEGDYVLTRIANRSVVVWDTRRLSEHVGSEVRADRGGHIPGAIHLNWEDLQKEVGGAKVLKGEEEIRVLLSAKGITPDREIIAHCQTGIRSSYATLVLLGLNYQRAKNYDGSWIEWANNQSLPIAVLTAENEAQQQTLLR
ncbi:MAG: sulfurtransferase [Desulfuromonadales bacterium]|nr:sulfurtransferase [Desulfuromonadales bacterium]